MLIERPPQFFRKLIKSGIFRMNPSQKSVYLTFDDGPIPEITPRILDILKGYGIKATFFMVGQNVEQHPELLEKVIADGHAVGNHTHRHVQGRKLSTGQYLADVSEASGLIPGRLFRPPHGWLRPEQTKALQREGYKIVMYDLVTRDYSRYLNAANVIRNVKKLARNGSIIVFHDSLKSAPRLFEALPASIEWLLQEGYTFEVIKN